MIIDSYVKWQILDAATYYLTTAGGNKLQAEELLRRRINNSLRSQIGRLTIHEIVSGQNNGQDAALEESDFDTVVDNSQMRLQPTTLLRLLLIPRRQLLRLL